ncbi:hypothetical protein L1987_33854 [Smallanthus sonchifolius]|uniref:Uncharacterized protein n=3 Tax=Smallanthus sonchifolius TaxID=185202 RepID=A0ACB9HTD7_9ASTR|nr:hypothetical protein L1987_33848 [Smallanthus sonchifolius]KAI3798574.1 hypothetical protein L1987_33851 [Smallanthus sonchifolius]KAI3798577.1 hypothetical protein L1987_33854 [Smallanthus sonchifolius]
MAGRDHVEWGIDYEEWERMDMDPPPPHLYAEQFDGYEEREREENKVVVKVVKVMTIPSFYVLFGLLVACNHSHEVVMEGTKNNRSDGEINHQKLSVDLRI